MIRSKSGKPRRRTGPLTAWIRWSCTITALLVLMLFLVSLPVGRRWSMSPADHLTLVRGRVEVEHDPPPAGRPVMPLQPYRVMPRDRGITLDSLMIDWNVYPDGWFVRMPLWIPFLLLALPAGFLWYQARHRSTRGCCGKCGYELAGLAGRPGQPVICPECGSKQYRDG